MSASAIQLLASVVQYQRTFNSISIGNIAKREDIVSNIQKIKIDFNHKIGCSKL